MEPYPDVSGRSGIAAYEIGDDYIRVQFKHGGVYTYTVTSTGEEKIARMKALAREGRGLGSYINRHVRKAYARREDRPDAA